MKRKIVVIVGHPDPSPLRFGRILSQVYESGAREAGHEVRVIDVAALEFPLLRTQEQWNSETVPKGLRIAHADILWAEHLLIVYPLWLGDMPALLKGFLEQVLRPGDAVSLTAGPFSRKPLSGKTARIVVTMGMPAWLYRWGFGAHSLKSLKRNILWFVGVSPVRHNLIGGVAESDSSARLSWLARMRTMGRDAR